MRAKSPYIYRDVFSSGAQKRKGVGSARVGPCCLTKEATLGDLRYAATRFQEQQFHTYFRLPIGDLISEAGSSLRSVSDL